MAERPPEVSAEDYAAAHLFNAALDRVGYLLEKIERAPQDKHADVITTEPLEKITPGVWDSTLGEVGDYTQEQRSQLPVSERAAAMRVNKTLLDWILKAYGAQTDGQAMHYPSDGDVYKTTKAVSREYGIVISTAETHRHFSSGFTKGLDTSVPDDFEIRVSSLDNTQENTVQ